MTDIEEGKDEADFDSLPVETPHLINMMRKLLDEGDEEVAGILCELSTDQGCCRFLLDHGVLLIVEKTLLEESCSERTRELCCIILVNVIALNERCEISKSLFLSAANLAFVSSDPQTLFAVYRFLYSLVMSSEYHSDDVQPDLHWFAEFDAELVERSLVTSISCSRE
jgi:hypothetical protein